MLVVNMITIVTTINDYNNCPTRKIEVVGINATKTERKSTK